MGCVSIMSCSVKALKRSRTGPTPEHGMTDVRPTPIDRLGIHRPHAAIKAQNQAHRSNETQPADLLFQHRVVQRGSCPQRASRL